MDLTAFAFRLRETSGASSIKQGIHPTSLFAPANATSRLTTHSLVLDRVMSKSADVSFLSMELNLSHTDRCPTVVAEC
jgi:hypothetical protein